MTRTETTSSERGDEEKATEQHREYVVNRSWINPLHNKSHAEMHALTSRFLHISGLDEDWHPHIRRACPLAQDAKAYGAAFNETGWNSVKLRPFEVKALRVEASTRWQDKLDQPFILFALVACCSLGAAVQGWDETAVNQAQGFYVQRLQIPGTPDHPSWLLGLVNSAPYLGCVILGCWMTEPLNRFFGRRGALFIACLISSLSCIWQAFTYTWWQMLLARFLLGLGIGPKSATAPIYASECSPKNIRGSLVMMWQMWTAFGLMMGYVAGVALGNVAPVNVRWRLIIGSPMIFPLIVCAYVYCLPESPRWLLWKARETGSQEYYTKAADSLRRLRRTKLQAARDLFLIYCQLENEDIYIQHHNRLFELWTVPRNRRALIASVICMFFQQFCGVNVMAYYSTDVFSSAGYSSPNKTGDVSTTYGALLASMGFGILNFVFAIPAIFLIDTFGRRSLLLATFPAMAICHMWTGFAFLCRNNTVRRKILVTLGMYLFCIVYSPGEGPVPFVYASESMPLYVRALGMSIAIAVNWLFTFLLAITFPSFWNSFSPTGTFMYYAVWCCIGFVLILLFVPETKGYSLEELDAVFSTPMQMHMRHGREQLTYFVRYYLFCQKSTKKPQPYFKVEKSRVIRIKERPRKISFDDNELSIL